MRSINEGVASTKESCVVAQSKSYWPITFLLQLEISWLRCISLRRIHKDFKTVRPGGLCRRYAKVRQSSLHTLVSLIYVGSFRSAKGYRTRSGRSVLQTQRIVERRTSQNGTWSFYFKLEKHRKRREEEKEKCLWVKEVTMIATICLCALRAFPCPTLADALIRLNLLKVMNQRGARVFQLRPMTYEPPFPCNGWAPAKSTWGMPRTNLDDWLCMSCSISFYICRSYCTYSMYLRPWNQNLYQLFILLSSQLKTWIREKRAFWRSRPWHPRAACRVW